MFTLKFYKRFIEDQSHESVISCPRYEKTVFADGSTRITAHTDGDSPNIEFHVNSNRENTLSFSLAYIENSAGKTIDRIEPLAVDNGN